MAVRPELTQGAILDGIRLSRYGAGRYGGFLITARCDLAHVRTDTVNLLPIIPLTEWLRYDGSISILLTRLLALQVKIITHLNELPAALRELIRTDWSDGFELFVAYNEDVPQSLKNKLRMAIEEYGEVSGFLRSKSESANEMNAAVTQNITIQRIVNGNALEKKITDLIENKVMDAHFLPVVSLEEKLEEGSGYVILFRQIVALPGRLVSALNTGAQSEDDLPAEWRGHTEDLLNFPSGIIANVKSPYVEHILQRFSNVFARIGVQDCSDRYKKWLAERYTREGSI